MDDPRLPEDGPPPLDPEEDARLDAEAEADARAGRVVSRERVREWLDRLAKGEDVPPPEA